MRFPKSFQGPASALTLLSSLASPEGQADESSRFEDEVLDTSQQVASVIESPDALRISHFQRLPGGRCSFEWNGNIGKTYRIEMSEDLQSWETLSGGLMRIENPEDMTCLVENLEGHASCFFRVSEVVEPYLPPSSSIDRQSWLNYVSRFSETLSVAEQQDILAGTFDFSEDPNFEISVADKQAEVEARVAGFSAERTHLVNVDKYRVQQHNQRIYEAAAIAALQQWFPGQNYGADKASYLNTDPMRNSLDVEIHNRGGYIKEKTNNEWNEYFQNLEHDLWKKFEEYKKQKEVYDWKKNLSLDISEVDFTSSLEEMFPVRYEINDSNRADFEQYVQDVLDSLENDFSDENVIRAREALLLQPEFLQTEINKMNAQIAADYYALEKRISDAANIESARTGEPKRWIAARLWGLHPYVTEKVSLNKKTALLNRLTQEFLTPEIFTQAREARNNLARNHDEDIESYERLRQQCLEREAFLESLLALSPEDRKEGLKLLEIQDFHLLDQAQSSVESQRSQSFSWTEDIGRIHNILPTLKFYKTWEDFLYNEYLPSGMNSSSADIERARQTFLNQQDTFLQKVNNLPEDEALGKYWQSILSNRTPLRSIDVDTLRRLVYAAHNSMVALYEQMATSQQMVANPMVIRAQQIYYAEQLEILKAAEKMYFDVLDLCLSDLEEYKVACKDHSWKIHQWLTLDPSTRGDMPLLNEPSLEELLAGFEKRLNDALLRATLYGKSHKGVELQPTYADPEEVFKQFYETVEYFGSPAGKAITNFEHERDAAALFAPGSLLYERYKDDKNLVDEDTGEVISQKLIVQAEMERVARLRAQGIEATDAPFLPNFDWKDVTHLLEEEPQYAYLDAPKKEDVSVAMAMMHLVDEGEGLDFEKGVVTLTSEGLRNLEFKNAIERNIIAGRDPFSYLGYMPLVAGPILSSGDVSILLRGYAEKERLKVLGLLAKYQDNFPNGYPMTFTIGEDVYGKADWEAATSKMQEIRIKNLEYSEYFGVAPEVIALILHGENSLASYDGRPIKTLSQAVRSYFEEKVSRWKNYSYGISNLRYKDREYIEDSFEEKDKLFFERLNSDVEKDLFLTVARSRIFMDHNVLISNSNEELAMLAVMHNRGDFKNPFSMTEEEWLSDPLHSQIIAEFGRDKAYYTIRSKMSRYLDILEKHQNGNVPLKFLPYPQ